jgi:CHAT domain-containing protein
VEAPQSVKRLRQELLELELSAGLDRPVTMQGEEPLSLDRLKSAIGASEALLAFHIGESTSYLWALTRERLELHRLPAGRQIRDQVQSFREALLASPREQRQRGSELHRSLFGELSASVLAKQDWTLMLDDALFDTPFAALRAPGAAGKASYLIEEHSLRVVPGASFLLRSRQGYWQGPFVAVGDPIYNAADPRFVVPADPASRGPVAGFELARLVGSSKETRNCMASFNSGGQEPALLEGATARMDRLRAEFAKRPGVLHFATHVIAGKDNPRAGYIAMGLHPGGTMELLGSLSISHLRVHPLLVVMSGCHSGRGRISSGEGLMGLSRSWLQAGAANVAATLWPTPDRSGELLSSMYKHLGGYGDVDFQQSAHRALRLAQVDMIRSGGWRAKPSYWGAYFLVSRN